MAKLSVVKGKGKFTRERGERLVAEYMAMTRTDLAAKLQSPDTTVEESTIAAAVGQAMKDGNFDRVQRIVEKMVQLSGNDTGPIETAKNLPEARRIESPTNHAVKELDIEALRNDLVMGIYVSSRMMAQQAVHAEDRINGQRAVVGVLEAILFKPEIIAGLPSNQQLKLYEVASKNLAHNTDYIKDVAQSFASGVEAMNQIQKLKLSIPDAKAGEGADVIVAQVRELIQAKIKERVEAIAASKTA